MLLLTYKFIKIYLHIVYIRPWVWVQQYNKLSIIFNYQEVCTIGFSLMQLEIQIHFYF